MKHWSILLYIVWIPLLLLVSIGLTVTKTILASLFDFRGGRIDSGTFGAALTSGCSGHYSSFMTEYCSIADWLSATQSSSLSFGCSNSPLQSSYFFVSEMIPHVLPSSLLTGWQLILQIQQTFNIWVRPPGKFVADKAGGKEDLSDYWNSAAPSCW